MNGAYTTIKGRECLAKAVTTEKLVLSRIMVGKGIPPPDCDFNILDDLFDSVAEATSDEPTTIENAVTMIIEYRNNLNGGLLEGFWLSEFAVFALDPEEGEVLLLYGTLGENPQYVVPFTGNVDIRRFPVSIPIIGDVEVDTVYAPAATLTWEDLANHNSDPEAHESLMHCRIQLWVQEDVPTGQGVFLHLPAPTNESNQALFVYPEL